VSTTPAAIREALAVTIEDLVPAGISGSRGKYRRASSVGKWEELGMSEVDRGFRLSDVKRNSFLDFGSTLIEAIVELEIGHQTSGKPSQDADRRGSDLEQLCHELQKNANRPSDVWLVRQGDISTREIKGATISTVKFRLVYSRAA